MLSSDLDIYFQYTWCVLNQFIFKSPCDILANI